MILHLSCLQIFSLEAMIFKMTLLVLKQHYHQFAIGCVQWLNCVQLFVSLCTVAHQAPLSMEFPSQEYQSGLPFPSPGGLPDPGIIKIYEIQKSRKKSKSFYRSNVFSLCLRIYDDYNMLSISSKVPMCLLFLFSYCSEFMQKLMSFYQSPILWS